MRVLAARFPNRQRASAALDALRQRLELAEHDASIAPLGTPGERDAGDLTLLAGHFRDNETGVVRSLVSQSGGEVVADVDEQWTRPRYAAAMPAGTGPAQRRRQARDARRTGRSERQPIAQ